MCANNEMFSIFTTKFCIQNVTLFLVMKYEYSIQYTHIFFIIFFVWYLFNQHSAFPLHYYTSYYFINVFTQQIYCAKDLRKPPILHTNIWHYNFFGQSHIISAQWSCMLVHPRFLENRGRRFSTKCCSFISGTPCDLFLRWALDVCLVFLYFKKDSAYTGHVESGSTSDIMGYICRFLFFYWKVEKLQN